MNETNPTPKRPTELPPEIAAKSVLGLRGTELEKRKRFPRTRRWIFNFAATLSLVLFVGTYWLWLRGADGAYDAWDSPLIWGRQWSITFLGGHIDVIIYSQQPPTLRRPAAFYSTTWEEQNQRVISEPFGEFSPKALEWFHGKRGRLGTATLTWVSIPKWFLQLLFAILPLWWLGRFAVRWSEKRGMRAET